MHDVRAPERWSSRDVAYEMLAVLWDGPRTASDLLLALEAERGLRPRRATIGPVLRELEDGGFIRGQDRGGNYVYTITQGGSERLARTSSDR